MIYSIIKNNGKIFYVLKVIKYNLIFYSIQHINKMFVHYENIQNRIMFDLILDLAECIYKNN